VNPPRLGVIHGGRPSQENIPFTTSWYMKQYGLTLKQAQNVNNRDVCDRLHNMKSEARTYMRKLIAENRF
jgi:hypothetical protein